MGLFTIDIVVGFLTTYINVSSGDDITDVKMIAMNYILRGTFFLDVISTFPLDYFFESFGNASLTTGLQLLGLLKM
jgi:hypothetical protein